MDEEYDCIVLGTGLKECIVSGVLAVEGTKVLVLDRNDYYGGECASLNIAQLYRKFKDENADENDILKKFKAPAFKDRIEMKRWLNQWSIDLIPKFIMYSGELVRILVRTEVTRYLEFQRVAGSYVYKDSKIHKVPSTAQEAFKSSLMGIFEKRRCAKFLEYCANYVQEKPETHQGIDCTKKTVLALYDKFGLDDNTRAFIGHACALWPDESYLRSRPAIDTIQRIILYRNSVFNLNGASPYVYPRYGLTQLPEAFARLGAVHGSTYILNQPIDEVVYDDAGKVVGVRAGDQITKCKFIIGDPSYFKEKVKPVGKIVRALCILSHPIPNTMDIDSVQIIIPSKHSGRNSDIYVMSISSEHCVAASGYYIAIVSTKVETDNPERELDIALRLLGHIEEKFISVSDLYEPVSDGTADQCFITSSYDEMR